MGSSLTCRDNINLFFNIGVSIFFIQIGMLFFPGLNVIDSVVCVLAGTVIGTWMLSKIAEISATNNLTTGEIFNEAFGSNLGTNLLIGINAFTVVGWAVLEVMIIQSLVADPLGISPVLVAIASVAVIAVLCFTNVVVAIKKAVGKYISPILYAVMLWLTGVAVVNLANVDIDTLKQSLHTATGDMPFWLAMDLVIAMPVSWAFIISEMTKHSTDGKSAFRGSFIGYAIANAWCMLLGVAFAITSPGTLATDVVLALPLGILLAFLISLAELDNGYSNALSAIAQVNTLTKQTSDKLIAAVVCVVVLVLALTLDFSMYQSFVLAVGSIVVPALGVVLSHFIGDIRGSSKQAFFAWAVGLVVYQVIANFFPTIGATLPSIAISSSLYWIMSKFNK